MGKAALLALGVMIVAEGYQLRGQMGFTSAATSRVVQQQGEALARTAAVTDFEAARHKLTTAFASGQLSGSVSGATYTGSTSVTGLQSEVHVEGRNSNGDGTVSKYRASGRLIQEVIYRSSEAPTFMQFGLITEESLSLNGNVLVDTFRVEGNDDATFNANMHTNGKLTVKGSSALIRGFGSYVTTADVQHATNVFRPFYRPAGSEVVKQVPRVEIPLLSFTPALVTTAYGVDRTTVGDQVLSGTYDFRQTVGGVAVGTRENPYVWNITGNASIGSTATFHGYVIFVVAGDLTMAGNAIAGLAEGPTESHVAWYIGDDLTMRGNTQLWGQFVAKGSVSFAGTPRIFGSITANDATISGTPKIYYMHAGPTMTRHWETPETHVRLISYAESPVLD